MALAEASPEAWQWTPGTQLILKTSFGEVCYSMPPSPLLDVHQ